MCSLLLDASSRAKESRRLTSELEAATGATRSLIGLQALGNSDLLALPLMALATVQVEALFVFGGIDHVSLWTSSDGEPECLVHRGAEPPVDAVQIAEIAIEGADV